MMRRYIALIFVIMPLLIIIGCKQNAVPKDPSIPYGVDNGWVDSTYTFYTSTTDLDGDDVSFQIDWGDGELSGWSDFITEGSTVYFSYAWTTPNVYDIKAKAKDINNKESEWSGTHTVTIATKMPPPSIPAILDSTLSPGLPDTLHFGAYDIFAAVSQSGVIGDRMSCQFSCNDSVRDWSGFQNDTLFKVTYTLVDTGNYVIKARARNESGGISDWSPSDTIYVPNRPPLKPTINSGPDSGFASTPYEFQAEGHEDDTDPDEQKKAFQFAWGNGDTSDFSQDTLNFYSASYAYADISGTFQVRVRTKDRYDAMSVWSDAWEVKIVNLYEANFGEGIQPTGITTDGINIYVAYFSEGVVRKFDMSGAPVAEWNSFSSPRDVGVDDGHVYVTEWASHRILKLDKNNGTRVDSFGSVGTQDTCLKYPCGIVVDDDFIYVTEFGNNRIHKFTKAGGHITVWGEKGSEDGQFERPTGITQDNTDRLYITDTQNSRVQVFTKDGDFVDEWGETGNMDGQFVGLQGIFWCENNLYITDTDNHRIQVVNEIGEFVTRWGMQGDGMSQLMSPHNLMVHADKVYVTDTVNDLVKVFSKPF
ncbi:hypothetical protein KAX35_04230 [candidate division WOR-3 bacterium]|nr:hypothetical protein [candidate division WOR-3 bacterium]